MDTKRFSDFIFEKKCPAENLLKRLQTNIRFTDH